MQCISILRKSKHCFTNFSIALLTEGKHSCTPKSHWIIAEFLLERNKVHIQTALLPAMHLRLCYISTHILCVFAQGLKTDQALLRKVPSLQAGRITVYHIVSCMGLVSAGLLTEESTDISKNSYWAPEGILVCLWGQTVAATRASHQHSLPQKPEYVLVGEWRCCPWYSSWLPYTTEALELVISFLVFYRKCLFYWK